MENQADDGILGELQNELRKLPNKSLFFGLLAAWFALFHFVGNSTLGYVHSPSLFAWALDAYHPSGDYASSEDVMGMIMPFIVVAVLGWKLKQLVELPLKTWVPGLGLLGLALMLHLLGFIVQQPRISMIAFLAGLYILMGLVWGPAWLGGTLFPMFLLAVCVPLGSHGQVITTPLQHLVARLVEKIAHLGLAPDLVREGTQIFDAHSAFRYDIAPACSGIRSLTTLLSLTTVFGFLCFKSAWRRAFFVLVAFPLAVFCNVMRISFVVFVAEMFGQDAGAFVEQKAGFVTFALAITVVLFLEHWLREDKIEPSLPLEPETP